MKFFFSNVSDCKLYTWIRVNLRAAFFPEHFRAAFLFCWNNLRVLLEDSGPSLQYSIFFSFLRWFLPFYAHLRRATFDIPEVYLDLGQLSRIRYLKHICKKRHLRCLVGFFMGLCIVDIWFTCQTNLMQKTSQISLISD